MANANSPQVPTTEQIIQTLRKTSNMPPRGPFLRVVADRLEDLLRRCEQAERRAATPPPPPPPPPQPRQR